MSDATEQILIVQIATLLIVIIKGAFDHFAHKEIRQKFQVQGEDIHKIEVATNSMKDALVQSTAQASKAEGVLQGVEQERGDKIIRDARDARLRDGEE